MNKKFLSIVMLSTFMLQLSAKQSFAYIGDGNEEEKQEEQKEDLPNSSPAPAHYDREAGILSVTLSESYSSVSITISKGNTSIYNEQLVSIPAQTTLEYSVTKN